QHARRHARRACARAGTQPDRDFGFRRLTPTTCAARSNRGRTRARRAPDGLLVLTASRCALAATRVAPRDRAGTRPHGRAAVGSLRAARPKRERERKPAAKTLTARPFFLRFGARLSMQIHTDVVQAIGNTPLIRLRRASEQTGCEIL